MRRRAMRNNQGDVLYVQQPVYEPNPYVQPYNPGPAPMQGGYYQAGNPGNNQAYPGNYSQPNPYVANQGQPYYRNN